MPFKEMDTKKLLDILRQPENKDVLTGLVAADQDVYDNARCPQCGGHCAPEASIQVVEGEEEGELEIVPQDRPVPRHNARCLACKALHDPFTGIQLEMGNLALIEPDIPLVHGD